MSGARPADASPRPADAGPAEPDRAAAASRVLARAGVDARVTIAGQAADIAAVAVPPERLADVAAQADAIRALGFRYIAIEIGARSGSAGG